MKHFNAATALLAVLLASPLAFGQGAPRSGFDISGSLV